MPYPTSSQIKFRVPPYLSYPLLYSKTKKLKNMKTLNMFIHARVLQQIGHARLAQFLDAFEPDLKALNLSAPPPLPATHYYFTEVADFLANTENLPPRLLQALSAIESAASPENSAHLASLLQDHPDCSDPHPLA